MTTGPAYARLPELATSCDFTAYKSAAARLHPKHEETSALKCRRAEMSQVCKAPAQKLFQLEVMLESFSVLHGDCDSCLPPASCQSNNSIDAGIAGPGRSGCWKAIDSQTVTCQKQTELSWRACARLCAATVYAVRRPGRSLIAA